MYIKIERKNPKDELARLLYLDEKDYKRLAVTINSKYANCQPAIFYTALSRGYRRVQFADLNDDVLYQLEER